MKYKFIIMYLGNEVRQFTCNSYDKARKYFYREFFNDDQAILTFIDGQEVKLFDAYDYFNIREISVRYGLIPIGKKEEDYGN